MTDSQLLHRLLYLALLDIRARSTAVGETSVARLADLFHVVALQLGQAADGQGSTATILDELQARARRSDCESWVENAMRQLDSRPAQS